MCEQTNSNHVKYDTRFSIKRVKHMVMLLFLPLYYLKLKFIVCAEEAWPGIVSTGKFFICDLFWLVAFWQPLFSPLRPLIEKEIIFFIHRVCIVDEMFSWARNFYWIDFWFQFNDLIAFFITFFARKYCLHILENSKMMSIHKVVFIYIFYAFLRSISS